MESQVGRTARDSEGSTEFRRFGLGYESSWPLMIAGAGITITWRALEGPDCCSRMRRAQEP